MSDTATTAPEQYPVMVAIGKALNALHDNDPAALSKPLAYRQYDAATLAQLWDRIARSKVRVRGQVDRSKSLEWIEPTDYGLQYRQFYGPGRRLPVIVAVSKHSCAPDKIEDRSATVRPRVPGAAPRNAVVVRNIKIERATLIERAIVPADGVGNADVKPADAPAPADAPEAARRNTAQTANARRALKKRYPCGTLDKVDGRDVWRLPDEVDTTSAYSAVLDELASEKVPAALHPSPDTVARVMGRKKWPKRKRKGNIGQQRQ